MDIKWVEEKTTKGVRGLVYQKTLCLLQIKVIDERNILSEKGEYINEI